MNTASHTTHRPIIFAAIIFAIALAPVRLPAALTRGGALRSAGAQTLASTTISSLLYTWNSSGTLYEAGSMSESSSPYFWLNSGAKLLMGGGVGSTVLGPLAASDPWRVLYNQTNPLDTASGTLPQNIFRLVTKSVWTNSVEELPFKITKLHMTETPNRGGYSGVLLFSRYADGDNLYYAGIRQDGDAVIKIKRGGVYATLAEGPVFFADAPYDRDTNPNLIPGNRWMRLKLVTTTLASGFVELDLFLDKTGSGLNYAQVLSALDDGSHGGTLAAPGSSGIRTDYEDVLFGAYRITAL